MRTAKLHIILRLPLLAAIAIFASSPLSVRGENPMISALVKKHDTDLDALLARQVTDPASPRLGGIPDATGLYNPGAPAGLLKVGAAAYLHSESKHHGSRKLFDRMKLAVGFLERGQTPDGNVDLLITNFNSPPDTGFVVLNVATAANLARIHQDQALFELLKPFLLRAGTGMAKGGVHTPNHRWVVSAALSQLNELFPDERYVNRINAWLAEGIDIDAHGQYNERSTSIYNAVTNTALVLMARKLSRPELFDPVRRNLDAMAHLLHPGGEVVTEISRRQDLNTRGDMGRYWFALRTLAIADENGLYASMLAPIEPAHADLAMMMEYPDLNGNLPAATPIPDDYIVDYPEYALTRVRRGDTSAVILHTGQSRWISLRQGAAVIPAVRFSSAFFGKAQFVPDRFEKRADGFYFFQDLEGPYYQPLTRKVGPDEWETARPERRQTEVCHMSYEGIIRETDKGFAITIRASGTNGVPLAIEIALREGGEILGAKPAPAPAPAETFLLEKGFAEFRMGDDTIRFGPGRAEHSYIEVRGAEPKPTTPCVYLTGFTPFEHTIEFEMR